MAVPIGKWEPVADQLGSRYRFFDDKDRILGIVKERDGIFFAVYHWNCTVVPTIAVDPAVNAQPLSLGQYKSLCGAQWAVEFWHNDVLAREAAKAPKC